MKVDSKIHHKRSHHQREIRSEYIVDETLLKGGYNHVGPENRQILAQNIAKDKNILIAERFLSGLVKDYENHLVSTDCGT